MSNSRPQQAQAPITSNVKTRAQLKAAEIAAQSKKRKRREEATAQVNNKKQRTDFSGPDIKKADPTYKPGQGSTRRKFNTKSAENLYSARGVYKDEFYIDKNGEIKPIKTAIVLHPDAIKTTYDLVGNIQHLSENLKSIPGYSPIKKFIQFNANKSPEKGITGSGVEVTRVKKYKFASAFSSDERLTPVDKMQIQTTVKADFFNTLEYKAVLPPSGPKENVFNYKKKKNKKIKNRSQNKVMARPGVPEKDASANKYAQASRIFAGTPTEDTPKEWTHGIPASSGEVTREKDLVEATIHANTDTLVVENNVSHFDGPTYLSKDKHIPKTQLGTTGNRTIEKDNLILPVDINLQDPNPLHMSSVKCLNMAFKNIAESAKNNLSINAQVTSIAKNNSTLFHYKPVQENIPQPTKRKLLST